MRCDKCKWWLSLGEQDCHDDDKIGTCKRTPPKYDPSWISSCIREGYENHGYSYEDTRHWNQPCTDGANWCGEFILVAHSDYPLQPI